VPYLFLADPTSNKFSSPLGCHDNDDDLWGSSRATSSAVGTRPRLTRKMSADCMLDYCTYQMQDDVSAADKPPVVTSRPSNNSAFSARRSPSLHFATSGLNTTSTSTVSTDSNTTQAGGVGDLAKAPLQLRMDLFRPYPPAVATTSRSTTPYDGLLSVHVYSGRGLAQTALRAGLQELYCVAAVDGICRARTAVHSGTTNFDWDDRFIVDIYQASALTFGVYTYDGRGGRHRLCYTSSVTLNTVFRRGEEDSPQRLAVRLDPRGLLYVELYHRGPAMTFCRSTSLDGRSMFGVSLPTACQRDRTNDVPSIVRRCVDEVERRGGLDQVGIYQLCGSAKRAQRLRHELEERGARAANNVSLSSIGDINVITG